MIHINDAFDQFFGYNNKKDFTEAVSFFGFRKNTLTSDVSELILEIIKRNGNWKEEVLFEKINGEIYLGRLDITTFLYEGRNHFLQRIINIDSQRIFSENLFREIKKFEALFEYATLPILRVNKAGSIILANRQALNLFNYSENEMTLLNIEDLMPMKYRSRHQSHRDGYVNVPQSRMMGAGMELSAIKKSGEEFPVEISLGHYQIDEETYTIFDFDKYSLTPKSSNVLSQVVAYLKKHPSYECVLFGHTDLEGSDQYNIKLSRNRVNATRTYLTTHGISLRRISTDYFGERKPVISTIAKPLGWKNRRVEFHFIMN